MTKTKTVNGGNTAERIRKSIRNSVANLIKIRYRHSGITSTTNEEGETTTRTYKRTYHTLSDIVIRVFDSLIDKMVQITRNAGKKTIGVDTFVAAMKLLPTIVMPDDGEWDKFIDAVLSKADKIVETIPSGKAQKRERGISNLNAALEADGCFIRGTSLSALVRSKIPFDWWVAVATGSRLPSGCLRAAWPRWCWRRYCCPQGQRARRRNRWHPDTLRNRCTRWRDCRIYSRTAW